jgi:peptide deformylase
MESLSGIGSAAEFVILFCRKPAGKYVNLNRYLFMALLKIVHYPDPVLLTVGKPVEEFDENLKTLVSDMFETMYAAKGVGLAAPQVAVSQRLFVMDCSGGEDDAEKIALINPEIIHIEGEQYGDEGCLSFPGLYQKVQRSLRTIVRAQDVSGNRFELDVEDLPARCVLHETDHCDGIVFLDRMTVLKRQLAKQKIKRLQKTGKWE